jgi:hypothetical protein
MITTTIKNATRPNRSAIPSPRLGERARVRANDSTIKNSSSMMTIFDQIEAHLDLYNYAQESHDLNLMCLVNKTTPSGRINTHERMLIIASFAVCWLKSLRLKLLEIFEMIANERLRQRQLFAERKFSFTCSSPVIDPCRKFRVLMEEIGEVAEAIDYVEQHPKSKFHRDHLITELVQVAAIAVAWLESFEVQS